MNTPRAPHDGAAYRKLLKGFQRRADRALKLREDGKSWNEIGLLLGGISRQRAQQLAKRARERQGG